MAAIRSLIAGQQYCVVQQFVDYDQLVHPVGATWVVERTNFVPCEDGLTLHVLAHGVPQVYRFQWRPEEQGTLIEHFTDFVKPV